MNISRMFGKTRPTKMCPLYTGDSGDIKRDSEGITSGVRGSKKI